MRRRTLILSFVLMLAAASAGLCAEITRDVFPLERAGVRLHLECMKAGDSGDPLLLVHGLTFSSHVFDVDVKDYSLARFFAHRGFHVWLLDIAGYGRSQEVEDGFMPDSDYAAEDILAAVKFILAHEGRKSLDLLGWSWGGVTTGRFAAAAPELVRKLVLYAPVAAGLGQVNVEEEFNSNTWENAASDFQKNNDGSINYDITEPEVVHTFLSNCWRYDKDKSPNGGRRDLLVPESERLIPSGKIAVPVLLIAGTKDVYVTPELCREVFGTLSNKGSRLEIIDGAGHVMMMERPYYDVFRQRVLDFLRAN